MKIKKLNNTSKTSRASAANDIAAWLDKDASCLTLKLTVPLFEVIIVLMIYRIKKNTIPPIIPDLTRVKNTLIFKNI